jgi:hypothetical protein
MKSVVASRKASSYRSTALFLQHIRVMGGGGRDGITTGVLGAAVLAPLLTGMTTGGTVVRSVPSVWVRVVALCFVCEFIERGCARIWLAGQQRSAEGGSLTMHHIRGRRGLDFDWTIRFAGLCIGCGNPETFGNIGSASVINLLLRALNAASLHA